MGGRLLLGLYGSNVAKADTNALFEFYSNLPRCNSRNFGIFSMKHYKKKKGFEIWNKRDHDLNYLELLCIHLKTHLGDEL